MTRDLHERKGATVSQVNRTYRSGGNAVTEIPHPNLVKTQEIWDLVRDDRAAEVLDSIADDIIIDNGPGAGPWRHVSGKDAYVEMALSFPALFEGTWNQDGRCIYADDTTAISLVHETGTLPNGDLFDNRAIWAARISPEGLIERLWTVDFDSEHCESFWERNKGLTS
jgi:hypothetical protein